MSLTPTWNRRTFLTALGLTTAATTLPAAAKPASEISGRAPAAAPLAFAFVSMVKPTLGGCRTINTYRIEGGEWTEVLYPFETYFPYALAAHPTLPILYTGSIPQGGSHGNPRRGRVTAISIDESSFISVEKTFERSRHWLNELGHQPLALATTRPRQIAVSPDGRTLLVADSEGGHYNLVPIAEEGSLLPVAHVLKQTGSGPHPSQTGAQPHSVLFHPHARLAYTTNAGTDQLNLLSLAEEQPRIVDRLSFSPGSGPADLSLHPAASFLLVTSRLRPSLSVVPLDRRSGAFSPVVSSVLLPGVHSAGPTAINAAGTLVFASSSTGGSSSYSTLSTLRLSRSGRLTPLAQQALPHLGCVTALAIHGPNLILGGSGGIVRVPLDPRTGMPGAPSHVVIQDHVTGIVLRSA